MIRCLADKRRIVFCQCGTIYISRLDCRQKTRCQMCGRSLEGQESFIEDLTVRRPSQPTHRKRGTYQRYRRRSWPWWVVVVGLAGVVGVKLLLVIVSV